MAFWNKVQKIQGKRIPRCSVIVAAAGVSTRMGGQNKLFAQLAGAPVLMRTLCAIDCAELVGEIVVAAHEASMEQVADLCARAALRSGETLTDDCAAVERLGKRVWLAAGDEENIKITTPLDLAVAEAILRKREAKG